MVIIEAAVVRALSRYARARSRSAIWRSGLRNWRRRDHEERWLLSCLFDFLFLVGILTTLLGSLAQGFGLRFHFVTGSFAHLGMFYEILPGYRRPGGLTWPQLKLTQAVRTTLVLFDPFEEKETHRNYIQL